MNLSFANPELLLLLPAPALVAWWRRRAGRGAIRYSSVGLFRGMPSARWPVIAGEGGRLLALLAVVIGMAGPRTPDLKTRLMTQGITVMLVLDTSGSMEEQTFEWQPGSPAITRREAAKRVFRLFIAGGEGPDAIRFEGRSTERGTDAIGLVTFSTWPQLSGVAPRIVERCSLPLTGPACVNRIYTDLAVIAVTPDGLLVTDLLAGMSEADLQATVAAPLRFAPGCRRLRASAA